jgi:hypothetical protein
MPFSLIFVVSIWIVSPSTIRGMPMISPAVAAVAVTIQAITAEALAVSAIRESVSISDLSSVRRATKQAARLEGCSFPFAVGLRVGRGVRRLVDNVAEPERGRNFQKFMFKDFLMAFEGHRYLAHHHAGKAMALVPASRRRRRGLNA